MARVVVTVDGTGPGGRLTATELVAVLGQPAVVADAPVKARTTLGGWLKQVRIEVER